MNKVHDRVAYFDFIKAFSIFLVVYVHYSWISTSKCSNLSMIMTVIAVPLFFMINGALLLSGKKFNIKKHYLRTLWIFIGIFSWKTIIAIICLITKRIALSSFSINQWLEYYFTSANLSNVPAEHLWFMYSLFRIYTIYPFIRMAFDKKKNI